MTLRSQRDVLRDWWYSPERHAAITSMRFAKSIERTLAEAGYVIVPIKPLGTTTAKTTFNNGELIAGSKEEK